MNLSFWKQVQQNWQSAEQNTVKNSINSELLHNIIKNDIASSKEKTPAAETVLELSNNDDFWGGF